MKGRLCQSLVSSWFSAGTKGWNSYSTKIHALEDCSRSSTSKNVYINAR